MLGTTPNDWRHSRGDVLKGSRPVSDDSSHLSILQRKVSEWRTISTRRSPLQKRRSSMSTATSIDSPRDLQSP